MPSFSNISNGEAGSSVRNTLNQVIDYVNTGITQDDKYVTGGTYNNSTGTLTLNRPDGSVNVTGFTTGFTETQNLQNVLALGNTTGSNDIVVNNGQSVQSVSGNTKMEFVSDTQLDITSTGNVYISGGTSVELEYYGSPTITSYLLLDNTNNKLYTDDGLNTNEFTQTPLQSQSTITDGNTGSYTELTNDGFTINLYAGGVGSYNNSLTIDPSSSNLLQSTDGTNTNTITQTPTDITISSTDGTNTSTQSLFPTYCDFSATNGTNTNAFTVDSSSNSISFLTTDDNTEYQSELNISSDGGTAGVNFAAVNLISGLTTTFTMSETSSVLSSTDGTFTNTITIDPDRSLFEITDGTIVTSMDFDANNGTNWNFSDGTIQINVGYDAFTGTITNGSDDGTGNDSNLVLNPTTLELTTNQSSGSIMGFTYNVTTPNAAQIEVSDGVDYSNIIGYEGRVVLDAQKSIKGQDFNGYIDINPTAGVSDLGFNNVSTSQGSLFRSSTDAFYVYQSDGVTNVVEVRGGNPSAGNGEGYFYIDVYSGGNVSTTFSLDPTNNNYGTTLTQTIGDITDTLIISPDSNVNNTKLRSEDTNTGQYSELVMTYDNPSFDCSDGGTTSSNLTLTPSNPVFNSSDGTLTARLELDPTESSAGTFLLADNGTWTSKLSLDPSDNFDQTGLETTDGTNTNNIRVNQNGVSITTADGVNSVDLSFTSTNLLLTGIPSFDDDATASGLTAGSIYQTTGNGAAPLDVAGILMIKQ